MRGPITDRRLIAAALAVTLVARAGAAPSSSPVADAAMRGDGEAVRTLLRQGADVNAAQGDGMTALHHAAERGDAELTAMLLYAGASVAAATRIGQYTPLHVASQGGFAAVAEALLKAGAGAASGSADLVKLLIDHGADVDARDAEWGQTPLIYAAALNRADAIRVLLDRGADPSLATKTVDLARQSALDRAATERQRKVLEAAVPRGEQPTASQVQAAMHAARELVASGKIPPSDTKEGAAANDRNAPGAANNFDPEEINPPVATKGGLTALLHAARQGYVDAARALLDGGAAIDQGGAGDATTPLLMAAINGQFDMAMFLIERGADPDLGASGNGVTPLWAAVNAQWQPRTRFPQPQEMSRQHATYLDLMRALLDAGANPDARVRLHPWFLVYSGCGNRNCGLADTAGSTAFWRAAYAVDVHAPAGRTRRRSQHSDHCAAGPGPARRRIAARSGWTRRADSGREPAAIHGAADSAGGPRRLSDPRRGGRRVR